MFRWQASFSISLSINSAWVTPSSAHRLVRQFFSSGLTKTLISLHTDRLRAEAALCRSASLKGLPFLYARFAPDEEVTAFSVCDISPPQYSNRDRFAENTTVFWNQRLENCDEDLCWRTNQRGLLSFKGCVWETYNIVRLRYRARTLYGVWQTFRDMR